MYRQLIFSVRHLGLFILLISCALHAYAEDSVTVSAASLHSQKPLTRNKFAL